MNLYIVVVGVALRRPPRIHEYRKYVVLARNRLEAELLALQWASFTCVMPIHREHAEEVPNGQEV